MVGLFDCWLPVILNPAEMCIRSSHPWLLLKYILKLAEYFEDHNIVQKVTEIQHAYNYKEVEKLDELITAGILFAKWECRHDVRFLRSEEIHETMTQGNILRIYMSTFRNKVDCTDQIEEK